MNKIQELERKLPPAFWWPLQGFWIFCLACAGFLGGQMLHAGDPWGLVVIIVAFYGVYDVVREIRLRRGRK